MSDQLATYNGHALQNIEDFAMDVECLQRQANIIKSAMEGAMQADVHYGTIPGCGKKPTLLKPGSEKLMVLFRLRPALSVREDDMINGHKNFTVTTDLYHIPTGNLVGSGVGSCSTMEAKYKFRAGGGELTDVIVPKQYWDARKTDPTGAMRLLVEAANYAGHEGSKFGTKKDDTGTWRVTTHGERVEHDNPADYYNTCMKMAAKRSKIDAVLNATAASDIFTQDIEDMVENGVIKPTEQTHSSKPVTQPPQAKPQTTMGMDEPPADYVPADYSETPQQAHTQDNPHAPVRMASEKQLKMVFAKQKNAGIPDVEYIDYLSRCHNIDHRDQIPFDKVNDIIKWIDLKAAEAK